MNARYAIRARLGNTFGFILFADADATQWVGDCLDGELPAGVTVLNQPTIWL